MRHILIRILIIGFSVVSMNAQTFVNDTLVRNSNYLEDQFYLGVTYNFLLSKPETVTQRNLSYGLQVGLIKDIPLNKKRTIALGVGLGLGINSYYSNMLVSEIANGFSYTVLESGTDFKRSKIETHLIEMPFEFRWRNSTPEEYKFWRAYAGVKLAYVAGARSKFISDSDRISFYNTNVEKFQYGAIFSFGYNTFNIHIHYALNALFDNSATLNGEEINSKPLRVGFIFYIL